jgi:hypothetical protein
MQIKILFPHTFWTPSPTVFDRTVLLNSLFERFDAESNHGFYP